MGPNADTSLVDTRRSRAREQQGVRLDAAERGTCAEATAHLSGSEPRMGPRRILLLLGLMSCDGIAPQEEPPDGGSARSIHCPSVATDGSITLFDICFGFSGAPPFVATEQGRELHLTATAIESSSTALEFSSCVAPEEIEPETLFFTSEGLEYKLAVVARRGDGDALPNWRPRPGDSFDFAFASDGFVGSSAVAVTSERGHLLANRYGLVELESSVIRVERGSADGPAQSNDCGLIQPDSFMVWVGEAAPLAVRRDECIIVEPGVLFLGVQAFHPVDSACTDALAPLTWAAVW